MRGLSFGRTRRAVVAHGAFVLGLVGCDRHAAATRPAPFAAPLPVTVNEAGARRSKLEVTVDCAAHARPIHPEIYGTGFDPSDYSDRPNPGIYGLGVGYSDLHDPRQWELRATGRRFGGNPSTRYNWETGTFNHGSDWVFANDGTPAGEPLYETFLRENETHRAGSAITIPILGWIAKDRTSASFPVSKYPDQSGVDSSRAAGDGRTGRGRTLTAPSPTETSIISTPELQGRWVKAMAARPPAGDTGPRVYILDNEPGLWNSTHRDIHPDPITYDELLSRTLPYAHAIRENDPHGLIAGPSAYGWPDYLYSGKDAWPSYKLHLDRRRHDDLPILAYYLRELHRHEQATGERLLDLLDVHFYPQTDDVGVGAKGETDPATAARRIRSTRALWDPTYIDESWIHEPIRLLPRLQEWIDAYDPGVGIEIGEWDFGAEGHMSGALAVAEALGRFADAGVARAYYWTFPPPGSATFFAFRAFRNFDGRGGHFEDGLVPLAASPAGTSVWASRDAAGKHLVLVVLDFMPDVGLDARVRVESCGTAARGTAYTYVQGAPDFEESALDTRERGTLAAALPAYSISTIDVALE